MATTEVEHMHTETYFVNRILLRLDANFMFLFMVPIFAWHYECVWWWWWWWWWGGEVLVGWWRWGWGVWWGGGGYGGGGWVGKYLNMPRKAPIVEKKQVEFWFTNSKTFGAQDIAVLHFGIIAQVKQVQHKWSTAQLFHLTIQIYK